jgi:dephospho-CoA kinase
MKLLGLTGGVGMGKSTAAEFLRARGVRIVDTDEIARELVRPGRPALAEIQIQFGKKIIAQNGELNRAELARIVFADAAARKKLEEILHPKIRERWLAQIGIWRKENCPLAVVVIPLLFETQAESQFDKIICVACSAANRQKRLLERGWTPEQIEQRIAAQMPVDQKIARADYVVWTDGDLDAHARQLERILSRL